VGNGKTVTASGLTLTGADADKYLLTSFSATTTASIYTTPTVTTAALSSLTATTADGGGDVTADGGNAVTARGVCWSTTANPTTADSHTTDGAGTGAFTSSITGLTENTLYHVRAYATNAAGTSYGIDRTFTTTFTVRFVSDGTAGASFTGNVTQSVASGDSTSAVTAHAPAGHHFVNWTYGESSSTSNPLSLSPITGSITVTAHFAPDTYALTYSAGAHGSLTGNASQSVDFGGSGTAVTAVPAPGYHFVRWSDGVTTATRIDTNVSGAITVTASFAIDTYVIAASAGQHGAISPDGAVSVDYGADRTFAITPAPYYRVADVLVDGVSVGAVTSQAFTNVTASHTIRATFAPVGPPTTTVQGLPKGWVQHSVRLSLVAKPATDGAPVDYTEYRIGSGPWVRGATLVIKQQGVTTITYRSVDIIGDVETSKTCVVRIDRTAPAVSVGGEVNVTRGQVARFPFSLRDNLSGALRCKLVITWHGKVVLRKGLGLQQVGRPLVAALRCTLPIRSADHYCYRVAAVDAAGNRGISPGPGPEFEVWQGIWFD
jgi:hypothetical protein